MDQAFKKLELDETALIVDEINKHVDGSLFDPLETTIMSIDMSFYKGYRFLDIADHATAPPLQRYVFQKINEMDFIFLDWTYKSVYEINLKAPIALDEGNILDYVRFFFSYVKGRHGRFIICENADHIRWKDEPPPEIRKTLNQVIEPLRLVEKREDGVFNIKACMTLKNALFHTDIYVEPNGRVIMSDHEIMLEDIPVLDSVLGQ